MKSLSWSLSYNSYYAFVYSVFELKTEEGYKDWIRQKEDSYKSWAILMFCLDGKKVRVEHGSISVELDKLDEEFLKIAKTVPAENYGMWKNVCEMLDEGLSREEVLKHLTTKAISEGVN